MRVTQEGRKSKPNVRVNDWAVARQLIVAKNTNAAAQVFSNADDCLNQDIIN